MMDLFFSIGPALQVILQLGYEPKEKYFYELTDEQYEKLKNDNIDTSSKYYLILPDEYRHQTFDALVVTEQEKFSLIDASEVIEKICNKSSKTFINYEDKLKYISNILPPVFTKTPDSQKMHLKIV